MCASHMGEPYHLAAVRGVLAKIGCSEGDLACGGHTPLERCAYDYVRAGAPTPFVDHIYNKYVCRDWWDECAAIGHVSCMG